MICPRIEKIDKTGQFKISGTNRENFPYVTIRDTEFDAIETAKMLARRYGVRYYVKGGELQLIGSPVRKGG